MRGEDQRGGKQRGRLAESQVGARIIVVGRNDSKQKSQYCLIFFLLY